ncbi:MAG: 3-oxoacyl-ACP reductase, partial [Alphaproteobacteria bacterium]|nr:3-oxoacyl-ACP reductase [Alphaproteobacteria bacterium]
MVDLSGKVALITGAGQGVGFGIACAMSAGRASV